jgi:hypothetical protein
MAIVGRIWVATEVFIASRLPPEPINDTLAVEDGIHLPGSCFASPYAA